MKSDIRIAVCLGGQIRTGIDAYENIKKFIGDLWDQCDFFIHTWEWEFTKAYDRKSFKGKNLGEPLDKLPEGIFLSNNHIEQFLNIYKPKRYEVQTKNIFSVSKGIQINLDQSQFVIWHTKFRSIQLKHDYETLNNFKYDVVVMMRPDLIFSPGEQLEKYINNWNFNSNQICYNLDLFWIMSSSMSDFIKIKFQDELLKNSSNRTLGLQLTGEEITNFFIENDIDMKYITDFNFTILRKEAAPFNPITEYNYCKQVQYLYFTDMDESSINLPNIL